MNYKKDKINVKTNKQTNYITTDISILKKSYFQWSDTSFKVFKFSFRMCSVILEFAF